MLVFCFSCSDLGFTGLSGAPLVSRGGANRPTIRAGRGRGAAGSRAASARIYGTRRKSSSPTEVIVPPCCPCLPAI